jgi:soluble lytic murein transglycosylase
LLACAGLAAQPLAAAPRRNVVEKKAPDPATPEDAFLAARDALKAGNRDRLVQMVALMRGSPLEVYGDYWLLLSARAGRRTDADDSDYQAFLARYDKTYMGERARTDWLKLIGRKGEWGLFDTERAKLVFNDDIEVQCYGALRRLPLREKNDRHQGGLGPLADPARPARRLPDDGRGADQRRPPA